MGDKNTWQGQTRVYIEHCHWLLALRLSVTAAHSLASCSGPFVSRNSFRGTQTVTTFASLPNVAET